MYVPTYFNFIDLNCFPIMTEKLVKCFSTHQKI